jgi:maleamate amidohydrolase
MKWMDFVSEAALQTYREVGFLSEMKFGERSALMVVDVTYGFTGSEGLSLEQATDELPSLLVHRPGRRCRGSAS